jgi:uncharacterized protein YkwD
VDSLNGATRTYANGHSLDWHETDPAVIASEIALIGLINAHRASLGLDELQFDRLLTQCARGHSHHHHEHNLFEGHVNPENQSYVERMAMNGIDFEISGENLAYNIILPDTVFQQWLNSTEDRSNIERMCYGRIGVGLHQGAWTAKFAR